MAPLVSTIQTVVDDVKDPREKLEELLASHDVPPLTAALERLHADNEVTWTTGEPLSQHAWTWLVNEIIRESPSRESEALRVVRTRLSDIDCYLLCRALASVNDDEDATWPLFMLAAMGSPFQIHVLGRDLEDRLEQEGGEASTRHAVEVLRREGSKEAIRWLDHWAENSQHDDLRKLCGEALETLAAEAGMTRVTLTETATHTLGFDENREQSFDCGKRTITLRLKLDTRFEYVDLDGSVLRTLPRARVDDEPRAFKRGRRQMKHTIRQTRMVVERALERLKDAMVLGRTWPIDRWQALYLDHPILSVLGRRFIWALDDGGDEPRCFEVRKAGVPVDLNGDEVDLAEGEAVWMVHPVELDKKPKRKWARRMRQKEKVWKKPFKQVRRSVEDPAGYPDDWGEITDKIKPMYAHALKQRMRKRGWVARLRGDGDIASMKRAVGPYLARVKHERYNPTDVHIAERVRVNDVKVSRDREIVAPSELPPSVFSELLRDLKRFSRRPRFRADSLSP